MARLPSFPLAPGWGILPQSEGRQGWTYRNVRLLPWLRYLVCEVALLAERGFLRPATPVLVVCTYVLILDLCVESAPSALCRPRESLRHSRASAVVC